MLLLAHPAPDVVLKRGPEAGQEKDRIILPVQCPAVQSQTPILLDLGLDHTLQQRKGIVTRAVPAPHPVPPIGILCPALLPEGEGIPILLLVLALGVAPDHDLGPLKDGISGVKADDCTVPHIGPAMVMLQSQMRRR